MARQTLRDWVHRYNAEGLAVLSNRWKGARVPRLAPAQMAELATWVEAGPDPGRDGVVRWRRSDLARRIASTFGVEVHERTVGTYLATLGYRRLQVAPAAPENRSTRPRGFQKNCGAAVAAAIPQAAQGKPVEVWFQGEPGQKAVRGTVFPANARVGQQGTLTRIWAKRGTRPRAPRDTRYQWASPALSNRWRSRAHCSARSARRAVLRQAWSCPSSTQRR